MLEPGTLYSVVPGARRKLLRCHSPLIWDDAERLYIRTTSNFVFDGASISNVLWPLLRCSWLDIAEEAGFHDYMFRVGAVIRLDGAWIEPTRLQADVIFRGILLARGVRQLDVLLDGGVLGLFRLRLGLECIQAPSDASERLDHRG